MMIDSFDHDTDEPRGLRGEFLDRYILSTAKMVSIFWITETLARAKRIQAWCDSGKLVLEVNPPVYPWSKIAKWENESPSQSGD